MIARCCFLFWVLNKANCLICLNWKIFERQLVLSCLTSPLDLTITFTDPKEMEQAHCFTPILATKCLSNNEKGSIVQDRKRNVTTFALSGFTNEHMNGQWSCHHGRRNERATAVIGLPNSTFPERNSTTVTLRVPKYIKRSQEFPLECYVHMPSEVLSTLNVTFLVNDNPYIKLQKNLFGCWNSKNNAICNDTACKCFEDGKRFVVRHGGFNHEGFVKLSCHAQLSSDVQYSECKISRIIDIEGPSISTNQEFPVQNETPVEMTCFVGSNYSMVQVFLSCLNLTVTNVNKSLHNHPLIYARINLSVNTGNGGEKCHCSALVENEIVATVSVELTVKKIPLLLSGSDQKCKNSSRITLTCNFLNGNEFNEYGFSEWLHTQNGNLLKQIEGLGNKEVTQVNIWNCQHDDTGEYVCRAWGRYSNTEVWSNQTIRLLMEDSDKTNSFKAMYIPFIVLASMIVFIFFALLVLVLQKRLTGHRVGAARIYHAAHFEQPPENIYRLTDNHYEDIDNPRIVPVPEEPSEYEEIDKTNIEPREYETVHEYLEMN